MSKVASPATLLALALVFVVLFWRLGTHALGSRRCALRRDVERDAGVWRLVGPAIQPIGRSSTSQFRSISCRRWRCALFPIANSRSASCLQQPGLRWWPSRLWFGATMRTVEVGRAGALTKASNPATCWTRTSLSPPPASRINRLRILLSNPGSACCVDGLLIGRSLDNVRAIVCGERLDSIEIVLWSLVRTATERSPRARGKWRNRDARSGTRATS